MASITDYLNSQKQDSSYSARAKLAVKNGITGYTGTAAQNTQLLSLLQKPAPVASYTVAKPVTQTFTAQPTGSAFASQNRTGQPINPVSTPAISPFIGAKKTTDSSNLFSVSRPDASSYTTNSSGFQVPVVNGSGVKTTDGMGTGVGFGNFDPNANFSSGENLNKSIGTGQDLTSWANNSMNVNTSVNIPDVIPSDLLKRTDPITLPSYQSNTPTMKSLSEYLAAANGVSGSSAGSSSGSSDAAMNAYETQNDALGKEILSGMDKLGTKGAAKLAYEKQAGLEGYQKQLNDINGQLAALSASATSAQLDAQGKPIANVFINRQVDAIEREKTVKALGLSAIASTLQGNIALANDTVTKAIDAEFSGVESKIAYLQQALTLNESKMTHAEKAKAAEQAIKLKEYEIQVEAQKEEKSNIYAVMLEAAKNGADATTLNAIRSAKTSEEAIGLAGNTLTVKKDPKIYGDATNGYYQFDNSGNMVPVSGYKTTSGGLQLNQTQIKGLESSSEYKSLNALNNLKNKIAAYKDLVQQTDSFAVAGANKATLDALYADLKIAYKDAAGLGALTGPDVAILQEAIKPMSGWTNYGGYAFSGGKDGVLNSINTALNTVSTAAVRPLQLINARYSDYVDDPFLQTVTQPFSQGGQTTDTTKSKALDLVDQAMGFKSAQSGALNGSLSKKFESGGNPGAIGYDSTGGYSYGTFQLAHNNAKTFVDSSPYAQAFAGIKFNSPEFRQRWQQVAKADPKGFSTAQTNFIAQTHLNPQLSLLSKKGINVGSLSPTVKEVIMSTAIQHGPNTPIIANAIAKLGQGASEQDLIKQIYINRWNNGANFASSTPAVRQAVYNRYFGTNGELATALKMSQSYA